MRVDSRGNPDIRVPHQFRYASDIHPSLNQPAPERTPQIVRMHVFRARPLVLTSRRRSLHPVSCKTLMVTPVIFGSRVHRVSETEFTAQDAAKHGLILLSRITKTW